MSPSERYEQNNHSYETLYFLALLRNDWSALGYITSYVTGFLEHWLEWKKRFLEYFFHQIIEFYLLPLKKTSFFVQMKEANHRLLHEYVSSSNQNFTLNSNKVGTSETCSFCAKYVNLQLKQLALKSNKITHLKTIDTT